jgi:hypothetical protein
MDCMIMIDFCLREIKTYKYDYLIRYSRIYATHALHWGDNSKVHLYMPLKGFAFGNNFHEGLLKEEINIV